MKRLTSAPPTLPRTTARNSARALAIALILATSPEANAQTLLRVRESSPTRAPHQQIAQAHRPDHVLVKLTPEARAQGTKTSNVFKNAIAYNKLFDTADNSAWVEVQIDTQSQTLEQALSQLQADPRVAAAEPDYVVYANATFPNDPSLSQSWAVRNNSQEIRSIAFKTSPYSVNSTGRGKDFGLPEAWDTRTDCSSQIVAVIDSGTLLTHEDLVDNLWSHPTTSAKGHDYANGDTDPTDDNGHGTHVAGIIAARGNNSIGLAGVCWQAKIMSLKALAADGSGLTSSVVNSIGYARVNGAKVINMSLGGSTFSQSMFDALTLAANAGISIVVAAGNSAANTSTSATYPCNYEVTGLICVGAVDQDFAIASFSNYSTTHVDVGAPGTNIVAPYFQKWTVVNMSVANWTDTSATVGGWAGAFYKGLPILALPGTWNGSTNTYANNISNDSIWQGFNSLSSIFSGTPSEAYITARMSYATQASVDKINWSVATGTQDPYSTTYVGLELSGTSSGTSTLVALPLIGDDAADDYGVNCLNLACSAGFNFVSDASTVSTGAAVFEIKLDGLMASTQGYEILNGTSMASPQVAGLVALLRAQNPNFSLAEIKDAVLSTGVSVSSLSTKFVTSRVAHAGAAMSYVPKVTGVQVRLK